MTSIELKTRDVYNASATVTHYTRAKELLPPERAIASLLSDALPQTEMLDIGIGGGRTTRHFAHIVKRYVGVDYSPNMIVACQTAFPENGAIGFHVADACDMRAFDGNSFDLVLFSFNGLDCIPPVNRARALLEMKRVVRPGGHLVFSAHNSNYLPQHVRRLRPKLSRSPRRMAKAARRYLLFQLKNGFPAYGPSTSEAFVFDGAEQFAVPLVYIRPDQQLRQLAELGLSDVRVFGYHGTELDPSLVGTSLDPWIHYLCIKPTHENRDHHDR